MPPSLPRCEQCGARMTLNPDGGLWCQFCGTRRTDPDATKAAAAYQASGAAHEDYESALAQLGDGLQPAAAAR